jgi:4-aminobutyrate aminotransferase-like enzyme
MFIAVVSTDEMGIPINGPAYRESDRGSTMFAQGPSGHENVIRLIPPRTISDDELELAMSILGRAFAAPT